MPRTINKKPIKAHCLDELHTLDQLIRNTSDYLATRTDNDPTLVDLHILLSRINHDLKNQIN